VAAAGLMASWPRRSQASRRGPGADLACASCFRMAEITRGHSALIARSRGTSPSSGTAASARPSAATHGEPDHQPEHDAHQPELVAVTRRWRSRSRRPTRQPQRQRRATEQRGSMRGVLPGHRRVLAVVASDVALTRSRTRAACGSTHLTSFARAGGRLGPFELQIGR